MLRLIGVTLFLFFKQKTAYEMRISDWSSDVCSSDLRISRANENGRDLAAAPVLTSARRAGLFFLELLVAGAAGGTERTEGCLYGTHVARLAGSRQLQRSLMIVACRLGEVIPLRPDFRLGLGFAGIRALGEMRRELGRHVGALLRRGPHTPADGREGREGVRPVGSRW